MHIAHCAACRALVAQVIESRSIIKKAHSTIPEIINPNLVTQRIMHEINAQSKIGLWSQITANVDTVFVRYAFSAVSLVLILAFVWEWQIPEDNEKTLNKKVKVTQGSVLNMQEISNRYFKKRESDKPEQVVSRYANFKQNSNR
jgi:adenylate kinase family enzyme